MEEVLFVSSKFGSAPRFTMAKVSRCGNARDKDVLCDEYAIPVQYPLQQMVNHFALECKKMREKLYHFLNLPFLEKRASV